MRQRLFKFLGVEQHWIPQIKFGIIEGSQFRLLIYFTRVWVIHRDPSLVDLGG